MRIYSQRELEEMDYHDQQQAVFYNCRKPERKEIISPPPPPLPKTICKNCECEVNIAFNGLCRSCFREKNNFVS